MVHFNKLKLYLSVSLEPENQPTGHDSIEKSASNDYQPKPIQHQSFGHNLELVEGDCPPVVQQGPATPQAQSTQPSSHSGTPRYLQHSRAPPDRFTPFVKH